MSADALQHECVTLKQKSMELIPGKRKKLAKTQAYMMLQDDGVWPEMLVVVVVQPKP